MDNVQTLAIEKLIPGGDGLAHLPDGRAAFIPYVIPGEKCSVRITEEKGGYVRAVPLEIVEASSARVAPPCPHFMDCGGCDWQHIEYSEQLRQKAAVVKDAFRRTGKIELPDDLPVESGRPYGYRSRVQFQLDAQGRAGFMRRGTNQVMEITQCPVLDPLNMPHLEKLRADLLEGLMQPPGRDGLKIHVFSSGDKAVSAPAGEERQREVQACILGRTITFSLDCFFQSNISMLPALLSHLKKVAPPGGTLVDLFCGVGVYSAFLEDGFEKIIGVEENRAAIAFAGKNVRHPGSVFIGKSVEKLEREGWSAGASCMIVNPPRIGLTRSARQFVLRQNPAALIYISCNPVTQARDMKDLMESGYRLESVRLFDFYPQTAYCESAAVMKRKGSIAGGSLCF